MTEPHLALAPEVAAFYADRYDEDARLHRSAHGRLELLRTRELLERHLPTTPSDVLDVGGGTGVHARWLVEAGHRVVLVDPVPRHVEAATAAGLTALLGDARSLATGDASQDVTLLLGPLYHLVDARDRARALAEAVRVTRPGGLVIAAGIGRYAALLEHTGLGTLDDTAVATRVEVMVRDGLHAEDPTGFTTAYLHTAEGLAGELAAAGLVGVTVLGVEGPGCPVLDAADPADVDRLLPSAVAAARLLERDPALLAASPHLLAIGQVRSTAPAVGEPVVGAADPALDEQLSAELGAFNTAAVAAFGVTGDLDQRELTVAVRDADGDLVAGLSGWTWGTCAGVGMLWVRADQRTSGWGARLTAAAEDEARARGCTQVVVSSFTFEAPTFYQRLGYVETGRTEGIPVVGQADVHHRKQL